MSDSTLDPGWVASFQRRFILFLSLSPSLVLRAIKANIIIIEFVAILVDSSFLDLDRFFGSTLGVSSPRHAVDDAREREREKREVVVPRKKKRKKKIKNPPPPPFFFSSQNSKKKKKKKSRFFFCLRKMIRVISKTCRTEEEAWKSAFWGDPKVLRTTFQREQEKKYEEEEEEYKEWWWYFVYALTTLLFFSSPT